MENLYNLQYPIGEYDFSRLTSDEDIQQWIQQIENFPSELRKIVEKMKPEQLEARYRPGGWKVKQVIHHLADSHLNAYVRFKLALTEETPTIKPYDQTRWAELKDSEQFPVKDSLVFIDLLHRRWCIVLKSMGLADFEKKIVHPESGTHALKTYLGLYAWHGKHHLAQIINLINRTK